MSKKGTKKEKKESINAPKYIVCRPIKYDSRVLMPGEELIGMEQRRLDVMIKYRFVKVVGGKDDVDI